MLIIIENEDLKRIIKSAADEHGKFSILLEDVELTGIIFDYD